MKIYWRIKKFHDCHHTTQGYGLVFQQKGMLHAGLPVKGNNPKYIAQAGVLRGEPDGVVGQCGVFRYGPGLQSYWGKENEKVDNNSILLHVL